MLVTGDLTCLKLLKLYMVLTYPNTFFGSILFLGHVFLNGASLVTFVCIEQYWP